jgi:signal transduction histidine kinase
MYFLSNLPRLPLNLPYRVRLSIAMLSFLLCLGFFVFVIPALYNGALFAIPVALSAWMFKQRGALISAGCTVLVLIVYNSISAGSMLWPSRLVMSFSIGSVGLVIEGLIIGFLRDALDMADAARVKAQLAEQQLTLAYEQQQQLNLLKDQLLLNVNHELRTPLTEVLWYLELLRDSNGKFDAMMQMNLLNNAIRGCEELHFLMENMLDAVHADNDAEPPLLEKLPIANVVNEVLEDFDLHKQQEQCVRLDIPEGLAVWANQQYIHQVLYNLLSNAFKYSPPQTPVLISAQLPERISHEANSSLQVCVSVKDAGIGVPPDEIPLLFGKFMRLKRDVSGTVRGSGLGLYVSKQLVEAMGGRIWVESSGIPGEGSCFSFTLPGVANDVYITADSHAFGSILQS